MRRSIICQAVRFFAASVVGAVISISAHADEATVQAGLNAPRIGTTGGAQVYWGPLASQTTLDLSGNTNTNYPKKYTGGAITGSGGAAGTRNYCTAANAPTAGPGTIVPPSTIPVYEWYCNMNPPPAAPSVNFEDLKYLAQMQGNACGGQSCYNTASSPNLSSINDSVCTVNGQPKVWFFESSPSFTGGSYFCGILVSRGSVSFSGNGIGDVTATPPAEAWRQYEVATPNGIMGQGDTSAVDQYPGDAGLHSVKPFRFMSGGGGFNGSGLKFRGYIYASTGYTATGGTVILGAVQFGSGAASTSGGGTIFYEPTKIFVNPGVNTVNAPIITPPGGNFSAPVVVTIGITTPGAVIHFTNDGTTPNENSPVYNGPFELNRDTVIKAIGTKDGMNPSAVTTAIFTFGANPGGSALDHIVVSPASQTASPGEVRPYTAIAYTADNRIISDIIFNWQVTGAENGIDAGGNARAGSQYGTFTVTASANGVSGHAAFIVQSPSGGGGSGSGIDHIIVTPPSQSAAPGEVRTYTATAYTAANQVIPDVTFEWAVTGSLNQVNRSGQVSAGATTGTYTVSASSNGITGTAEFIVTSGGSTGGAVIDHIVVTPPSQSAAPGEVKTYTATAYTAANQPISGVTFQWAVTGSANQVTANGQVTAGPTAGTFTVSASSNGITGSATFIVTSGGTGSGPVIDHIIVSPATQSAMPGETRTYSATAYTAANQPISGVTFQWAVTGSANQITQGGIVTAGSTTGNFTVSASSNGISGSATFVVDPPTAPTNSIDHITVSPASQTAEPGQQRQYTATAYNRLNDPIAGVLFTWNVTGAENSITQDGLVTAGGQAGTFQVTAASGTVTGSAVFQVTLPTLPSGGDLSITRLTPAQSPAGLTSPFSLSVTGDGFNTSSKVLWNGAERDTLMVNATLLIAQIPPSDVAATGTAMVSVRNTTPTSATSNALPFTITANTSTGNDWPFIVVAPYADPNPTFGVTTTLNVLGGTFAPGGEANLDYEWMAVAPNPNLVDLGANKSNAAKTMTVTFRSLGVYHFKVRITDRTNGKQIDSGILDVTVSAGISNVKITKKPSALRVGDSFAFEAQAYDQFGRAMSANIQWSSSAGSMSQSVLRVDSVIGSVRVTASAGGHSDSVDVPVLDAVVAVPMGNLKEAKAYPVPFKSSSGLPGVTFGHLIPGAKIRIFTADGHTVRLLRSDSGDDVLWRLDNDNAAKVSSGVYFYRIDASGQKKEGKLVLIL